MSQQKVDRYKEEKANRKKIIARQKRKSAIAKVCACVIVLALVAWLGYSVYDSITRTPTSELEVSISAIDTYFDGLEDDEEETEETEEAQAEDTEEEETEEEDTEEEETEEEEIEEDTGE